MGQIKINSLNLGREILVEGGTTLQELSNAIAGEMNIKPICARVNNKTQSLTYNIYSPKQIEFLDRTTDSGMRVYVRSLCMMLYVAVRRLYPGTRLRIEHSIERGYYCRLISADGDKNHDHDAAHSRAITAEMNRLVAADLPFERHEAPRDRVMEIFREQGLMDKVSLLETVHTLYSVYYTLDGIADSYYGCLAPSTGHINVFSLKPYKEGFILHAFDRANPDQTPQPVKQEKMYKAFTDYVHFNSIIGVANVGELNRVVDNRHTADLINVAEALHEKYIAHISDEITRRYNRGGARVVLIAGPSSSGKTTTGKRLAVQLMTNLLKPVMISLDNYFVDREHTPLDEDGDYDYESLYALDLEQFNNDLKRLIDGEEVAMPTYNFETGKRQYKGNTIQLTPGSIILIEGIHGLNPELTSHIDEKQKFRVYVSALTTLSIDDHNWVPTTDNRLLRRIIRDYKYRGTSALDTLRRWPSVRRGEERWIFPYQENADAMFNSSLLFELGVMKELGEDILSGVPEDVPEYSQAYRLKKFLSYFKPISDNLIPPTSLLREFLGGSSFHY
jgi:uridine kinase